MGNNPLDSIRNLAEAFHNIASECPKTPLYSQAVYDGKSESETPRTWVTTDYKTAQQRINKIAHYLKSVGTVKGTKIAILSASRPEWMEADIAILSCGGVAVSVYQTLPEDDVAYILYDSGAQIVFAENQQQVDKVISVSTCEWDIPATEERPAQKVSIPIQRIISIEHSDTHPLVTQLEEILMGPEQETPHDVYQIQRIDIASFVYTSGTTGPPKGVIQSHGNHLSNVRQSCDTEQFGDGSDFMLFLPLAHSFAKLVGYLGFLTPALIKFPAVVDKKTSALDPGSVTRDIREGSATIVPVVPRLLEKMKAGVQAKASGSGLAAKLLAATISSALAVRKADRDGANASFGDKLVYKLTAGLRKKVKEKLFGPRHVFCISGGAKLPTNVGYFFDALGINILEGYGLTETCVATNMNRLQKNKIGTVGPVLTEDIELQIAEDGEILFRGPNVALGYHNRVEATRKQWDSKGWFHTGDLGSLDDDGYLTITGRKKEIIVTSNGKNIAPHDIEDAIKASPYVSQVVMIGDGRSYCTALITLEMEQVEIWARANSHTLAKPYSANSSLQSLISKEVDKVNEDLARHEQIKKFTILDEDFTIDNGLLTPTFKVKKGLVEKQYQQQIEDMYA
ncbi:MAG: long-chain fatty acid--CoA ligase [Deltaproteobacteria bacterium]|nr:long-chain fatty acid--CoA ligase [Deltaproteobacteria bacterium]